VDKYIVSMHTSNQYHWDPVKLIYIDKGPCQCNNCVELRAEEVRKAEAMKMLPEIKTAKEMVREFEERNGPVEAGKALFVDFETGRGKTKLRSQKARGLSSADSALQYQGPYWLKVARIEAVLPQQSVGEEIEFPAFARPCPVRPRHGFVESRVVQNKGEALDLLCETLRADPQGEMMIMRPLTGEASAVANDAGVVWAKGNDGVTSGKGEQCLIPVPKGEKSLTKQMRSLNWTYQEDIKGSAYLEIVENKGKSVLVQVRDGPADTPVGGNYIPRKDYEVKGVITPATEDLLHWEKVVLAACEGTVVYLPGGSLASHFAVHGLARKLAVVTDEKVPELGAVLQPDEGQVKELTKKDYQAMAKYAKRRIEGAKKSRAAFSVGVLHSLSAWGNAPHLLWLRMAGAGMMARLLVSACVGEARHFYRCGPGAHSPKVKSKLPWKKIIGKSLGPTSFDVERGKVLEKVYRYSIPTLRGMAFRARQDFQGDWGNGAVELDRYGEEIRDQGLSSFGGKKWAASARIAMELCDAIIAFERHPTQKRWGSLLMCYNAGVAAAHNGGRLLDKWAEWDEINACAETPQFGLISPQAMFICTGVKPATGDKLSEAGMISNMNLKGIKAQAKHKAKLQAEAQKEINALQDMFSTGSKKKTKSKAPKVKWVVKPKWEPMQTETYESIIAKKPKPLYQLNTETST
jgi:hypothetical protein